VPAFFDRFRVELAKYDAGVHDVGDPVAAERLVGRALPAQLADFYRSWDGARLFADTIAIVPLDGLRAAEGGVVIGEWPDGVLELGGDGRVRSRGDDGAAIVVGSSLEKFLAAVMAREGLLVERDGEFKDVFDDEGIDERARDKQTREIKEYPLDNFERIIQVNLIGTFRCITKSAAGMLTLDVLPDGDRGAIVNTASVAAEDGQIGQAAYTASKAGIVGLTLTVARDLSSEAIRVNTILPGIFDTPLLQRAPDRVKEALAAQVPFPRRLGQPEEYAQLAYTMITNGYFNGEDVRLDGAIRMTPR